MLSCSGVLTRLSFLESHTTSAPESHQLSQGNHATNHISHEVDTKLPSGCLLSGGCVVSASPTQSDCIDESPYSMQTRGLHCLELRDASDTAATHTMGEKRQEVRTRRHNLTQTHADRPQFQDKVAAPLVDQNKLLQCCCRKEGASVKITSGAGLT